jgi:hypothetical protein
MTAHPKQTDPSKRRRPITAGARIRHIMGAQGVAIRVDGNQVFVLCDRRQGRRAAADLGAAAAELFRIRPAINPMAKYA